MAGPAGSQINGRSPDENQTARAAASKQPSQARSRLPPLQHGVPPAPVLSSSRRKSYASLTTPSWTASQICVGSSCSALTLWRRSFIVGSRFRREVHFDWPLVSLGYAFVVASCVVLFGADGPKSLLPNGTKKQHMPLPWQCAVKEEWPNKQVPCAVVEPPNHCHRLT